jgi:hypothetical protein
MMVPNTKPQTPTEPLDAVPAPVPQSRLDSAGRVTVTYTAKPPKGPADKRIHPRRPLAKIPDAPPREKP